MTRIAEAKARFGATIEEELDELARDVASLIARARQASEDTARLNKLAQGFGGLASTLEHAATQVEDQRAELRAWLGTAREPITQYVSPTISAQLRGEVTA